MYDCSITQLSDQTQTQKICSIILYGDIGSSVVTIKWTVDLIHVAAMLFSGSDKNYLKYISQKVCNYVLNCTLYPPYYIPASKKSQRIVAECWWPVPSFMKINGLFEILMENTDIMDTSCYSIRTVTAEIKLHFYIQFILLC
jgi:hypothetical protein